MKTIKQKLQQLLDLAVKIKRPTTDKITIDELIGYIEAWLDNLPDED